MKDISFYRITDKDDKWFIPFMDIFKVSFPIFEQRDPDQLSEALKDNRYHLILNIENNQLVSFIAYWDFNTYVYIEHLAVNPLLRGNSLGSIMLNAFARMVDKTVVLEIDPLKDEISKKRFRFYEKLGYKLNPYKHKHPPYKKGYQPHELLILTLNRPFTLEEYESFWDDLSNVVMR